MTQTLHPPAPVADAHRSDPSDPAGHAGPGRAWAGFGLAAGVAAAVCIGVQGAVTAVFDPEISGDAVKVAAALADQKLVFTVFHVAGAASAVLLLPFAAGLHRRLRAGLGAESLVPLVAGFGVLITAMVMVMGTALDTDLGIFVQPAGQVPAEHVSFYGHWTGSVPSLWLAIGMCGLAVFVAWRRGAVSRAQGLTGLVLGGLAVLTGVSPGEYIAVMPGLLWLLAASAMFFWGDKTHRRAA